MEHEHCECDTPEFVNRIQEGMLTDDNVIDLADFFKIFADSTRISILWALHESEMCVQGLSACIGMSVSAVSHQLKTLKDANLVKSRRSGKMVYYRLCDEHIEVVLNTALEHILEKD